MIYAVKRLVAFLKPLQCSRRKSQPASSSSLATGAAGHQQQVSSSSNIIKSSNFADIADLSTESSYYSSEDSSPTDYSSDGVLAESRVDTVIGETDRASGQQSRRRQTAKKNKIAPKPVPAASAFQPEIGEPQYVAPIMLPPAPSFASRQMYLDPTSTSPSSCAAPQFLSEAPPGLCDVPLDTLAPPQGFGGVNYELPLHLPSVGFGEVGTAPSTAPWASWQQAMPMDQQAWAHQNRADSIPPSTSGRVQDLMDAKHGTDIGSLKTRLNNLSPKEAASLISMLEQRASSPRVAREASPWPQQGFAAATPFPQQMGVYSAHSNNFALAGSGGAAFTMDPSLQRDAWPIPRSPVSFQERQRAIRDGALRASEVLATARKNAIPVHSQDAADGSLSTFLRELSFLDNACVLMVRKISQLGLDASNKLRAYFSSFGDVDRVMAVPTKRSAKNNSGLEVKKLRPPAAGFVVMSQKHGAEEALKHGSNHVVAGVEITVHPFQSHSVDGTDSPEG